MDNAAYSFELEKLKKYGISALNEMIKTGYQENFYFDFKEISTQENSHKLSDNDRKNFAKAISGFSNTSGGLIIWGVRDNRNNTFTEKPVSNPELFVGLLNNIISSLSMPIMTAINSFVIRDGDKGYIVTEVPKYFFSPVQVNPLLNSQPTNEIIGRYYIRSGSDFVLANHDVITSLYNRNR